MDNQVGTSLYMMNYFSYKQNITLNSFWEKFKACPSMFKIGFKVALTVLSYVCFNQIIIL